MHPSVTTGRFSSVSSLYRAAVSLKNSVTHPSFNPLISSFHCSDSDSLWLNDANGFVAFYGITKSEKQEHKLADSCSKNMKGYPTSSPCSPLDAFVN